MSFFSFLSPFKIELKVSYPTTFLKLLRVTDSTWSLVNVGETLRVMALTSSIGTSTFWANLSNSSWDLALVLRRFEAFGAGFGTGLAWARAVLLARATGFGAAGAGLGAGFGTTAGVSSVCIRECMCLWLPLLWWALDFLCFFETCRYIINKVNILLILYIYW